MISHTSRLALAVAALAAMPVAAQTQARPGVSAFDPAYFARIQPTSAWDMIQILPGFRLIEGNADVRGYSGSGGNVLIDGQRPSSKEETLEDILRRIPAAQVARIELIRSGAAGVDMQGFAVMANIVRDRSATLSGRAEAQYATYRHGYSAPRIAGAFSYASAARSLDLTAALYREIDDEHGFGSRHRYDAAGAPLRLVDYGQPEGTSVIETSAVYRQPLAGGTLRLNGLFKGSRMFANVTSEVRFPAIVHGYGSEREHTRVIEGGFNYTRPLGARDAIELLGSHRRTTIDGRDGSFDGKGSDRSIEHAAGTETILRGVWRHQAGALSLETGAEGAINVLDSDNALFEDDIFVPLPNARVRVEEKRAEFFTTATWRLASALTLETGLRYEMSRIAQSGDSSLVKSLAFLKPRALATWSVGGNDTVRLLVEREVGQLDFADFVGAASLTSGTVTAGNQDLEPETLWRAEAAFEHRFGSGSLVLTARREWISNVVDRIPVVAGGTVFDAVGNIGSGRRDELEANLTLPLDAIGVKGVTLSGDLLLRRSRVIDPTTHQSRHISEDKPIEAKAGITHDLARWHLRWGVNYVVGHTKEQFKIDEIQIDRLDDRVDAFVEYKPNKRWTFRVFAANLTDSPSIRTRFAYGSLRGTSGLAFREERILRSGRYVGVTVQRNFGK
ncbi:MAG TPA: TonB-dependent receptor [Sphingomonas sp.]|nr:TonB-dependent receptor [Sphingomonas sp.]